MAEKKTQPRSFRFHHDTLEGIQASAKAAGMSVNAWMEKVATEALHQGTQPVGGENDVTTAENPRVQQSPSVEVSDAEAEAEGLTPTQLAGLLAAETEPAPTDATLQEALRAAYTQAEPEPEQPHRTVMEVTANPLPADVTDQWLPDDPDVVMPGVPGQMQPGAPQVPGAERAVFANDPLGLLNTDEEQPPAVEDEVDPYNPRPAGERWRPRAICDNGTHRRKITQENLRRVVCGDCGTVISKW